jgi:predicted transcriptional regulator
MKTAIVTFKVKPETKQQFDRIVKNNGKTSSQWLRSVVEQYVKREEKKKTEDK